MKINILTLFPKMFDGAMNQSIMWRAQDKKFLDLNVIDLREFGIDDRKTVDDKPYGGGPGMIIRVDVVDRAISNLQLPISKKHKSKIVLLDARGQKFTQKKAYDYSELDELTLICGHYEGIDHRVAENLVDEVVSIGDYVLTGGEIPAMVITDAVTRLIPGVIKEESLKEESFSNKKDVEYPQYTRPEVYNGWKVPKVLLSGDHDKIKKFRSEK